MSPRDWSWPFLHLHLHLRRLVSATYRPWRLQYDFGVERACLHECVFFEKLHIVVGAGWYPQIEVSSMEDCLS